MPENLTGAATAANSTFSFRVAFQQLTFAFYQISPLNSQRDAYTAAYISAFASIIIPIPSLSNYAKEIENLKKLYKNDMKYEKDDDYFVHKLSIFHHLCSKTDVSHEVKSKTFSSMLKNHVLNYYLVNINMLENA